MECFVFTKQVVTLRRLQPVSEQEFADIRQRLGSFDFKDPQVGQGRFQLFSVSPNGMPSTTSRSPFS
jgi:hypothetical protein